jgi:hypothetical protein
VGLHLIVPHSVPRFVWAHYGGQLDASQDVVVGLMTIRVLERLSKERVDSSHSFPSDCPHHYIGSEERDKHRIREESRRGRHIGCEHQVSEP